MSDWFESELGIKNRDYCTKCGEGDSDWCDTCKHCTYSGCSGPCDCPPHCRKCGVGDADWCSDCEQCKYCDGCECNYCYNCGQGDSDWCDYCENCRYCDDSDCC